MRKLRTLRLGRSLARDDTGIAMVLVIGVGSVLAILIVTAVAFSVNGLKVSRASSDWNAALAASYAGVEEYQSRLADDPAYFRYGNPASTFNATPTKVKLPIGTEVNPAFGLGATGTWATVDGSSGEATFRYEVDNSSYSTDGKIRLRSTGRVGNETRSIVADLKQQGFIDFLYFTDYEIQDPDQSGSPLSCVTYAWAGRSTSIVNGKPLCSDIAFGAADSIDGPVHSNDAIRACQSVFKKQVTTAYQPTSGSFILNKNSGGSSCTAATTSPQYPPKFSPVVGMPSTNSQIRKEVRSDLAAADVPFPGCLYTGPTSIKLNSNGTMTVRSPWTKKTRVAGDPVTSGSDNNAACGSSADLKSTAGATITVPKDNVVFVQNVPASPSDPNYWAATDQPNSGSCKGVDGGVGNGIGYPRTQELAPLGTPYGCRNGDVFLSGTLKGNLTINSENYFYIVGDVLYSDKEKDMLGIIGQNAVFVWNPVKDATSSGALLGNNREINGAILSVAHTFQVQNNDKGGDQGTLTVNGAIAQKFRGIVRVTLGTGQVNGYLKAYNYDPRLKYLAPPKFLSPVTTTYGVNIWVEVSPVFKATGVPF